MDLWLLVEIIKILLFVIFLLFIFLVLVLVRRPKDNKVDSAGIRFYLGLKTKIVKDLDINSEVLIKKGTRQKLNVFSCVKDKEQFYVFRGKLISKNLLLNGNISMIKLDDNMLEKLVKMISYGE